MGVMDGHWVDSEAATSRERTGGKLVLDLMSLCEAQGERCPGGISTLGLGAGAGGQG